MELLSCANCCHNPLRAAVVGLDLGYCTRHGAVLRSPSETTCGRLLRKDLLAASARTLRERHASTYTPARVCSLHAPRSRADAAALTEEPNGHSHDDVVLNEAVAYSRYESGTKIASLAAIRRVPGARADVALASLGRAYVHACFERSSRWTAGLHLLWWTLDRLPVEPAVTFEELRDTAGLATDRAVSIAKWTVLALRLYLLSDIGWLAGGDDVSALEPVADDALGATEPGDGAALLAWITANAGRIRKTLPETRYVELAKRLSKRTARFD